MWPLCSPYCTDDGKDLVARQPGVFEDVEYGYPGRKTGESSVSMTRTSSSRSSKVRIKDSGSEGSEKVIGVSATELFRKSI
jgi:hypothetical protein